MQLSVAKKSQLNRHICSANTNMGVSYYHKGDFKKSYECYKKSEQIVVKISDKNEESMLYGNKGMLFFDMGKLDDALIEYEKSYEIFSSLNNIRGQALINFEKSKILFYKNHLDESEKEISKSCEVFEKIGDLPNYTKALIQHSKIARKLNKLDDANKYIKKSHEISTKIKLDKLIYSSMVEQEIINMYNDGNSKDLVDLLKSSSSKFDSELIAYIHYNLWMHNKLESSKKIAYDLYKSLHKKIPKIIYKNYLNKLS